MTVGVRDSCPAELVEGIRTRDRLAELLGASAEVHLTGKCDRYRRELGTVSTQAGAVLDHNYTGSAALFVDAAHYDYRLLPTASAVIDAGAAPGTGAGESLQATRVYVHPTANAPRFVVDAVDIGAYEWPNDTIFVNGFDG